MIIDVQVERIHIPKLDEKEHWGVYLIASLDDGRKVKLPVVWSEEDLDNLSCNEDTSALIQSLIENGLNALQVVVEMLGKEQKADG